MTKHKVKCENFDNCNKSWTEKEDILKKYNSTTYYCSQECYDFIKKENKKLQNENRVSFIDSLLNKSYIQNQWSEEKENDF
tara:strand:+ start:242 stop:484 length:243 start_codon:yes stop_codon:yes gene_type:complete